MFPYYLIVDIVTIGVLGFLSLSFLIALIVILRSFLAPYKDKKDAVHYEGLKRTLVREAESLARELSIGK